MRSVEHGRGVRIYRYFYRGGSVRRLRYGAAERRGLKGGRHEGKV